jgi:gluconokinase
MGPSGSGKTSVGRRLSAARGDTFIDADDHHDARSVEKMRRGESLTDEDRAPWLRRLAALLRETNRSTRAVLACSALKASYRRTLTDGRTDVLFVYLQVGEAELARRLRERTGHYAGPQLLQSQLEAWEDPNPDPHSGLTLMIAAEGGREEVAERVRLELSRAGSVVG